MYKVLLMSFLSVFTALPAMAEDGVVIEGADDFEKILKQTPVEAAAASQFPDCPNLTCEETDEPGKYAVYCPAADGRKLIGYITWTNMPK